MTNQDIREAFEHAGIAAVGYSIISQHTDTPALFVQIDDDLVRIDFADQPSDDLVTSVLDALKNVGTIGATTKSF